MTRSFPLSWRNVQHCSRTALLALLLVAFLARPVFAAPGDVDPTFIADVTDFGGAPATIEAIAVQADGKILIGGNFYNVDGVESIGLARLNPDGSRDVTFTSPLAAPTVFVLAIESNGKILVGGSFFASGPPIHRYLVELNPNGSVSDLFENLASPHFDTSSNTVFSILIEPNDDIIIGGSFYFVADMQVDGLARISAGILDTALGTAAGLQNDSGGILRVNDIVRQSDGKLVIGGQFLTNQTSPQTKNFSRLNPNGTIDTTFANHGTPDLQIVYALAVEDDEQILVAGSFDTIGGVISPRLARVNPDGSIDENHVALNIAGVPFALTLQPDGKILLGLNPGQINGQERNGVGRLNPDWSLDPFYPSPGGTNGSVYALALQDEKVLIGGFFTTVAGTSQPALARLLDTPAPVTPPRFLNISTRLRVQTGDNVLIGGFIVTGNASKKVIIRAIGPSLVPFGIADALANPTLELHAADGSLITSNDDWKTTQQAEIEASGLAPQNEVESAIVATLAPAAYTAIVTGQSGTTGVGLVEVYDLDPSADAELANISTRGFVETGNNLMIGGFTLGNGTGTSDVVVRALGPSLTSFDVAGALADPTLEIHDGNGTLLATNDNWKETQQSEITATGLAPTNDQESAILRAFAPGAYTAIVAGHDGTTGVALVELYRLP